MAGAVKIELDYAGYGYVEIDGFRLPNSVGVKVSSVIDDVPRITVDLLAIDGLEMEISDKGSVTHECTISLNGAQIEDLMKEFEKRGRRCPRMA